MCTPATSKSACPRERPRPQQALGESRTVCRGTLSSLLVSHLIMSLNHHIMP